MPVYEYKCLNCGEKFEKLVRSSEGTVDTMCPVCDSATVEKRFSAFALVGPSQSSKDYSPSAPTCTTGLCGL